MFKLFGNKEIKAPVDDEMREWIEYAMQWLFVTFDEKACKEQKVYASLKELLNDFDLQTASLNDLAKIVAQLMDINIDEVVVEVYDEGERVIETEGGKLFTQTEEGEQTTAGLYVGKNKDGKYEVGIEKSILKDPVNLIATIAHEFSHIKLLGENRIEDNDEYLTDLLPIIYGLGVFGANSVFSFRQTNTEWAYKTSGYLTQMEWGYALAVYCWLREDKNPDWINSLPRNIQADYKRSLKFMENNPDKIFQQKV